MKTDWSDAISVIVPTYIRPDGIETALRSLRQQDVGGRKIEVIVADNDPEASARAYVSAYTQDAPFPVIYQHVPEPGVSNARNGAIAHARGRYLVFLDDDMDVHPDWISELIRISETYAAGISFVAVDARMPDSQDLEQTYMQPFFSRKADQDEGALDYCLGMGGSMIDLSRVDLPDPVFDPALNETGGEDDRLFAHLVAQGACVAYSPKSLAFEDIPSHRATPQYLWTRNIAFGQGPTQMAADKGWSGIFEVMKWMCVGVVQFCMFMPAVILLKLLRRPRYVHYVARTAQAVGKIFWWGGFQPRLYGTAMKTDTSSQASAFNTPIVPSRVGE